MNKKHLNKMAKNFLPKGFTVSGIHCGMKHRKKDLGLILSDNIAKCSGVFTLNKVKAAPVILTEKLLKKSKGIKAVIVNSANANCCTGKKGMSDAIAMQKATAGSLELSESEVAVCSTGIIGQRLPLEKIVKGLTQLKKKLSKDKLKDFANAILTTDKNIKLKTQTVIIGGKKVTITGICKGAGMVHPKMATMLCFVLTDANIQKNALDKALKDTNEKSFNAITVDGDMSTNDTVLVLANAKAENKIIKTGSKEYIKFFKALEIVMEKLAKDIVKDGEGATKIVTITVKGAKSVSDAEIAARRIANSQLVKTSIHGQDPNWGRIASSVGSTMIKGVNPDTMQIILDGVTFYKGKCLVLPKSKTSTVYKGKNVDIIVDIKAGKHEYTMFSCDLTKRYVEINAHYTT